MSGPLHDDMTPALLDRYLSGECAGDEVARVHAWLAAHSDHVAQLAELRVIREIAAHRPVWNVCSMWETVAGRLGHAESGSTQIQSGPIIRPGSLPLVQPRKGILQRRSVFKAQPLRWGVWSTAAALVMGVVVSTIGWTLTERHESQYTAASMLTYTTANGQRATITLPDGGTVALNVASRLEVPLDYMAGNRMVRLTGEGLFTVPHHPGTPLIVQAGPTAARVLGTSFVVRCYATDTATMVAVRDGKVAVGPTVVAAAQMVAVGRQGGVSPIRPSDGSQFTFAAGILTINGLPLRAAIVELDRWYDADIQLGDPTLAMHPLDGEFAAGSLADLTALLELVYNVHVVRAGRVLTLYPRHT
ncbi:MAG TPA: FecR domain-containing protein [Gemmatimonadaceae bacterium]|jgi:ferric-dicitrate binding protein FerR (iron transport regulator)|nr:FecR domain-containing protein [Gemmatimonadaceae bacterium]